MRRVGERVPGLAPAALDELQRGLSLVQATVLGRVCALIRDTALGREREHGLGL